MTLVGLCWQKSHQGLKTSELEPAWAGVNVPLLTVLYSLSGRPLFHKWSQFLYVGSSVWSAHDVHQCWETIYGKSCCQDWAFPAHQGAGKVVIRRMRWVGCCWMSTACGATSTAPGLGSAIQPSWQAFRCRSHNASNCCGMLKGLHVVTQACIKTGAGCAVCCCLST